MKFLDKLILKLFALIILVLTITILLVMTGIVSLTSILIGIGSLLSGETELRIGVIAIAILMLLSIKAIFFTSKNKDVAKDGIILENTNGKLVISKESLENLIASVVKEINGADSFSSRTILDKDKNLVVYVTAVVSKDVMIKDISNELQQKIKEAMKKTADLDVKEVNIKIKNITTKKIKGLPTPEETNVSTKEETVEENNEVEKKEE